MSVADSSAHADSIGGSRSDPLEVVLRRAGAVLCARSGTTVALSYGSAAGELAACTDGVGIASRSELAELELSGRPLNLDRGVEALLGRPLLPGGLLLSASVGWFRIDDRRLVALCNAEHRQRLRGRLDFWTMRDSGLALQDRTDQWSALAVIGRRAPDVLSALGVYGPTGDPRSVAPVTRAADDPATVWLLCDERYALVLTPAVSAPALWHRVTAAGLRWRICAVGHEALVRYRVLSRNVPLH